MKKTLLVGSALAVAVMGFAQNSRTVNPALKPVLMRHYTAPQENQSAGNAGTRLTPGAINPSSVCTGTDRSSMVNAFGAIDSYPNQVAYNTDINSVLLTHRRSANSYSLQTSGTVEADWYNLGTSTWDSMLVYRDSTANKHPARYPNGTLYNAPGNTVTANAYAVVTGPWVNGSVWQGAYYSAHKFLHLYSPPIHQKYDSSLAEYFIRNDMQQSGMKVYSAGTFQDTVNSGWVSAEKGGSVWQADFTSGSAVWTIQHFVPGFHVPTSTVTTGYASSGSGMRLAFNDAGTIGYGLLLGALNATDTAMYPIIYKCTNGVWGTTPLIVGNNLAKGHPECMKGVGQMPQPFYRKSGYKPSGWQINETNGYDMAVDMNGVLHIATAVADPYKSLAKPNTDSLMYGFSYNWDYHHHHPIIWDIMTDGTCWKTMMVDSILTSSLGSAAGDTTYLVNPWDDGSGNALGYGARIQISRSKDGSKLFYGWIDSDSSSTGTILNTAPDIMMKGYDVTAEKLTPKVNVTFGTAQCYFQAQSDVAAMPSAGNWNIPMDYIIGRTAGAPPHSLGGAGACSIYYVKCANFTQSQFTIPAVINPDLANSSCGFAYDVKANNTFASSVSCYPNPFNQNTNVVVNLSENKVVDLKVYDALGSVVFSGKINGTTGSNTMVVDGTSFNSGVYYYTVTAGNERVTKKMILQK